MKPQFHLSPLRRFPIQGRWAALLLGLFVSTAACEDAAPTASADASAPPSASVAPKPKPDEPEDKDVELLEKGKAPHVALRYAPKEGQKEVLEVTRTSNEATMDGKEREIPKGTFRIAFELKSKKGGDLNYELGITSFEMPKVKGMSDAEHKKALEQLQAFTKLKGSVTFTDRGVGRDGKVNVEDMPKELQTVAKEIQIGLESYVPRLPNGRVGVGAKWKLKPKKSKGMVAAETTTTYELLSIKNGVHVIVANSTSTAKDEVLEFVPGQKINMLSLEGTGTGKFSLSLDRIFPSSGQTGEITEMVLQGGGRPKKKVKSTMTTRMTATVD